MGQVPPTPTKKKKCPQILYKAGQRPMGKSLTKEKSMHYHGIQKRSWPFYLIYTEYRLIILKWSINPSNLASNREFKAWKR